MSILSYLWLFLRSFYIFYIKLSDKRNAPKGVTLKNEVVLPDCSFLKKMNHMNIILVAAFKEIICDGLLENATCHSHHQQISILLI